MGAGASEFQRGLDCLKAGQYEEAKRLFDENERKTGKPEETRSLLQQAEAALAAGKVGEAAALFSQTLDRNPGIAQTYVGLARIALFTGQIEDAEVHVKAAVALEPKSGRSWLVQGLLLEAKRQIEPALQSLKKAADLAPQDGLCQYNFGRLLAASGLAAEAIGPLEKALKLDPGSYDVLYALGVARKEAGQVDAALDSFRKATSAAPDNVDGYATRADVLFEARRFEEARKVLDEGLTRCGDHPALLEKAVATSLMQSDNPGAIGYLEREVVVAPQHEQAWLNLANLTAVAGDLERSEQAAQSLLKINPRSWEAHYSLGNLYEATGLLDKAEAEYRQAIELEPDRFEPRMNLGIALLQKGSEANAHKAVRVLQDALPMSPAGDGRIAYNLALAKAKLGQTAEALSLLEQLLAAVSRQDPIVKQALVLGRNLGADW